jgi:hypothetical protein
MTPSLLIILIVAAILAAPLAAVVWQMRRRHIHQWLGAQLRASIRHTLSRAKKSPDPVSVLLCIADHFEPSWGDPTEAEADARVDAWIHGYPREFGEFRDSDGRPPRHTFFYPIDQYIERHVDSLAALCRDGYGEIEIHLHHDHDTAHNLDRTLHHFTRLFADRHGVLGRWPDGRVAYGFVHGNWALDNARADGRHCGVTNELEVLRRTGCYADFTLPSAPDSTQTRKINSIYYAVGDADRRKSHDRGVDVGLAPAPADGLLLIQGPLRLHLPQGSMRPRIENGCIQRGQPPTMERLDQWIRANVHVRSRPDWVFVKLHTHGATERNQRVLLEGPTAEFHRALAHRAARDDRFNYHYVTAREMYNLVKAAEAGWTGPVAAALDFQIAAPRLNNPVPLVLGTE